ncbi:MAG: LemA family protein [Candidatus Micrarchaeota archaeon]|nr:LemA family protein [Candidatus Micrarchaeota archaeon]
MTGIELIILLIVIAALYTFITYNELVRYREAIKNAWAQIDVQLKRRADLIPNLVNAVKGYMKHERELLEKITELRSKIISGDPKERMEANDMLTGALKSLFAVAENYPDLKANQNVLQLQEELTTTENKIAYARQAYNDSAYLYNTMIKQIPAMFVAKLFGFKEVPYLEIKEEERKVPKVEL